MEPLMRKIWAAMKLFKVPINHQYIQSLTSYDLAFIEWSTALDNPEFAEKYKNTFYDDEFDDFWDNPDSATWDEETSEYSNVEDTGHGQIDNILNEGGYFTNSEYKSPEFEDYDVDTEPEDDDFNVIPDIDSSEINDWEVDEDE